MSKSAAKNFDGIADDYAFFERHATEAQEDVCAYLRHIAGIAPASGPVRMLDFGCGSGTFTSRFLELAGLPRERLRLTLVEPAGSVRREAVARVAPFTAAPIFDSDELPRGIAGCFEIVLSNHVLYYVMDLQAALSRLIDAVSPTGVLLAALAARTNALIEFWITGFGLVGREVPYNTSEDLELALRKLGVAYQKEQVPYVLTFSDTEENRTRIIRFLLADHLAEMPLRPLLALFDRHSRAGRIEIQTDSDHYTLRADPR